MILFMQLKHKHYHFKYDKRGRIWTEYGMAWGLLRAARYQEHSPQNNHASGLFLLTFPPRRDSTEGLASLLRQV